MNLVEIMAIAVGLAMDAFAVSIASSVIIGKISRRQVFRLAFHFGLFQAMMPVLGWLAGRTVDIYIRTWDHWAAFGLLSFIGGKAIYSALKGGSGTAGSADPSRGLSLVVLSVATSIDALAVGLSFAMLRVSIWYPSAVIGVITAGLSVVGVLLGGKLGLRFGRKMEVLGGAVLILIGVKILLEHIL
jgi:putative Mn2+ efflux pump MntP